MSEKYYVISEQRLREFLDCFAQSMKLEDEEAEMLLDRPVTRGEFDSMGETIYAWEEDT